MDSLNICEIYEAFSGEIGIFNQGEKVLFIRLAECNLDCSYCDTKYSHKKGQRIQFDSLMKMIRRKDGIVPFNIFITGGEPLLQARKVFSFISSLLPEAGKSTRRFCIETNGSIDARKTLLGMKTRIHFVSGLKLSFVVDYKLNGSGMNHEMNINHFITLDPRCDFIKYVIQNEDDFKQAMEVQKQIDKIQSKHNISKINHLFSPVLGTLNPSDLARWMIERNLDINCLLNVQIHKLAELKEDGFDKIFPKNR